MYLTSSLEPKGPRSTQHYIVLHSDNRRELIQLPKSYTDLKKEVEKLYHFDQFYIETKELNLCAGESIRIPEVAWGDIAELLGNVYVVLDKPNALETHPESASQPECQATSAHTPNPSQGIIRLEAPLIKEEFMVITLGKIDLNAEISSTSKLYIRVLDEKKDNALTVTTFLRTGSTFVASPTNSTSSSCSLKDAFSRSPDHHIVIYKQQNRFLIVYDSRLVGVVESPAHPPLTSIAYDLGSPSPIKGPVSANVYSDASHLRDGFEPSRTLILSEDRENLCQQILGCDPRDSDYILKALETTRREITSFKRSSSGIKWKGQLLPVDQWTDCNWNFLRHSLCVVRYNLTEDRSDRLYVVFSQGARKSLQVGVTHSKNVTLAEHDNNGKFTSYHTFKLAESVHTAGEHSIAFIVHGGQPRVIFDFKQSVDSPRTTLVDRGPPKLYINMKDLSVDVDLYEF